MSEWKEVRLGDVCTIIGRIGFRGYTAKDLVDSPDKGAISLSPTNIANYELNLSKVTYISWEKYNESPEIMVTPGDIVFSKTGTVGWSALIREVVHPITLNPQLVVFKDIKINPVYLSYVMRSHLFKGLVKNITGGSAVPTLTQKDLGNLEFPIADNETQNKIATILSSLDDKIAVNKKICDNLEAQARALYKHWFVDFVPFKDGKFVESELGLIPEGWRVGKLSELIDVKYGKDHKKLSDGNIPVYGSGGLMRKVNKSIYEGESVLIPRKGTLNNVMYVNEAFWTVDTMFYSIPKRQNIVLFTYIMLSKKDLASMNAGSAVPSMTTDILNNMIIIIPKEDVLEHFNSLVSALYVQIKHNEQESLHLSNLRDILLPKLMSGQIKL